MKHIPQPEATHWRLRGKRETPWSRLGEKTFADGIGFVTVDRATSALVCSIGCAINRGDLFVHSSQLGNAKRQHVTCIPHRPVELEFGDGADSDS